MYPITLGLSVSFSFRVYTLYYTVYTKTLASFPGLPQFFFEFMILQAIKAGDKAGDEATKTPDLSENVFTHAYVNDVTLRPAFYIVPRRTSVRDQFFCLSFQSPFLVDGVFCRTVFIVSMSETVLGDISVLHVRRKGKELNSLLLQE